MVKFVSKKLSVIILFVLFSSALLAANKEYKKMHENHHGSHGTHKHDEVNMPGLQGKDTTEAEVNDLKNIFKNHKKIKREVINIKNGIKTITESKDEKVRQSIIDHVTMMVTRMQEGKNPEVMIQSPTLTKLFDYYQEIDTEIELSDDGIALIQTSKNPKVVELLQKHASEINDMVDRGMQAVHERMMRSKNN
jgi:pectate lyase